MSKSIFGYLESDPKHEGLKVKRELARHEEWSEAILPADVEAQGPEGETDRRPLMMFAGIIALALGVLVVRLFVLQVVDGSKNLSIANGNGVRETVERAPRGIIYDRTGTVLATNAPSYDITVVPQLLPTSAAARKAEYAKLGSLIGMSQAQVQAKAEVTCKIPLPGCLDNSEPQLIASGVGRDQALLVDQDSNSLPGFAQDVNPIRQYDDNNLLSVILGYTGRPDAQEMTADPGINPTDLVGKLGLEEEYNNVLAGTNGGQETEYDASGQPIKVLASRQPVAGDNLVLSIDQNLQQHMVTAIQQQMTASGADRAAGVAIDPRNGQILAIASLPSYDNNEFSSGISQSAYPPLISNAGQPLFDKAVDGGYPSGSIIKPLGASAALQEGIITTNTIVDDTGKIIVPNRYNPSDPAVYYGWERTSGLGPVNVLQALAQSSDIFFYEVMGGFTDFLHYLGVDKLTEYYMKFGLGSRTGIDLPSESAGRVPTPAWKKAYSGQSWYTGDTYNIAVGQGDILVSPLQMAVAISAIGNGGILYQPHLVSEITNAAGKVIRRIAPKVVRQGFISQANLNIVKQGMELAVTEPQGTACCFIKVQVPVTVAAKTGTAETVNHDDGENPALQSQPDAWFEAFAPADNPRIAIVILLEHGGEGASFAAPAARETLAWYFTQGAGAQQ
jgi:penicillin-binding protein 2